MKKEFVTYEIALALKELGFEYVSTIFAYDETGELYTRSGIPHDFNIRGLLSAPTFSQAFRFLYHKLDIEKGVMPLDIESQQLLLRELIDKVSSKHLLV